MLGPIFLVYNVRFWWCNGQRMHGQTDGSQSDTDFQAIVNMANAWPLPLTHN